MAVSLVQIVLFVLFLLPRPCTGFAPLRIPDPSFRSRGFLTSSSSANSSPAVVSLKSNSDPSDDRVREAERSAALTQITKRRNTIRTSIRYAEKLRYFRVANGYVTPEVDEEKKAADSKFAVTITAVVVAVGAVVLRIGGRAALVSAVGLDFAKENPELKEQLDKILQFAQDQGQVEVLLLFIFAWTFVKLFLFDAGGVALALSSGILFGGVFQGALISAFAATIGSVMCFLLAKADTPVRKKALELVDENPSLRGIEKVVSQDGFKAILTLRIAPVLPIPLGMYNYVYGATNVPFVDFVLGIFVGSLKPYLFDSYLGVFGKDVVDGNLGEGGYQDVILLVALGVSVLIGLFASQLAEETWDSVLQEVEAEKKSKMESPEEDDNDVGIVKTMFGSELPEWMIDFQLPFVLCYERLNALVDEELDLQLWNYTKSEDIPWDMNPSTTDMMRINGPNFKWDLLADIMDNFFVSYVVLSRFGPISDPGFDDETERKERPSRSKAKDFAERRRLGSLSLDQGSKEEILKLLESETLGKTKDPPSELPIDQSSALEQKDIGGCFEWNPSGRSHLLLKLEAIAQLRLRKIDIALESDSDNQGSEGES